jgi:hypothetical protein
MARRVRARIRNLRRWLNRFAIGGRAGAPLFLLLLVAFFAVRVWGIGWGLEGTWSWDNDGIAPRDVFPGIAFTFTPGEYYTYPPLHLLLVAILCLPLGLRAAIQAPSLTKEGLIAGFLEPTTAIGVSLVARTVALVASGILAATVYRTFRATHGRRAAAFAAFSSAGLTSLSFYLHTSNLDVPFLAWSGVALALLTKALVTNRPDQLRKPLIAVAAAVATKDQAYALFLLSLPVYFLGWLALTPAPERANFVKKALTAIATGIVALLVFDGAFFNPRGFRARVHFLLGSASQDYAEYAKDWSGRLRVAKALIVAAPEHVAWPLLALVPFGLLLAMEVRAPATPIDGDPARRARRRLAAYLPALFAVSFAIAFNMQARRTEHRFAMPVWFYLATYAGVGADRLLTRVKAVSPRQWTAAAVTLIAAASLFRAFEVDINLAADTRYAVEGWLRSLPPNTTVETYGGLVYLPHFPENCSVTRIGVDPAKKRSPLTGAREVRASFASIEERHPEYVVANATWAAPYLADPQTFDADGRVAPTVFLKSASDPEGVGFFRDLFANRLRYAPVLHPPFAPYRTFGVATDNTWPFRRLAIHGTTNPDIVVFRRVN